MSDYLQNSKKYKKFPYDAISKSELNYLHKRTLEMFKEVVQIFDKNNINYMICGGTLLGAVTRNGFFPWDDDIDICVVESDYNKAKICLINNLPDNMILQCRETDPQYYHGWVKVRDKNSKVHPFESKYIYNGVWIDIYCLMPFKANTVNCEIVKEHVRYLFRRYASSLKGFVIFFKEVFNRNLISKFLSTFKDTFSDNNEEVYLIRSASNVIVQKKWCSTKGTYNFEGIEVKSFSDADAYLKSHYGDDYMKLPPPPIENRYQQSNDRKGLMVQFPCARGRAFVCKNIGDYVQSVASRQYIDSIDEYIEQEEANEYYPPDKQWAEIEPL